MSFFSPKDFQTMFLNEMIFFLKKEKYAKMQGAHVVFSNTHHMLHFSWIHLCSWFYPIKIKFLVMSWFNWKEYLYRIIIIKLLIVKWKWHMLDKINNWQLIKIYRDKLVLSAVCSYKLLIKMHLKNCKAYSKWVSSSSVLPSCEL